MGEVCGASGPAAPGRARRGLSFCRAGHRFAVAFVSTAVLPLEYPDVSMFSVDLSNKSIVLENTYFSTC